MRNAKPGNQRSFNLRRDYSNSLPISNASELVRIPKNHIKVQKEKEDFVGPCLRPPENVKLCTFHIVVVQ